MKSKVFQERQAGPGERRDGWIEIKLGYFYNDEGDEEVKMCLKEVRGEHLKVVLLLRELNLDLKSNLKACASLCKLY